MTNPISDNGKFLAWFEEIEGFDTRSERFFDDAEYGNKERLYEWIRTAWQLGWQAGRDSRD